MRPPSPWRGDYYERESPERGLSPSYSSPDRLSEPPLWHGGDNALHGSPFVTPVLPASNLQATVSPRDVFVPQSHSDSDREWEEDSLPSPIPSHDSLAAKARRPLSPVPSSSRLVSQQPPRTIFANPLKPEERPPTPGPSKRRATGKVKAPKDATIGLIPQGLVAKLKASPVHRDLVISQVFERQNGRYWSVVFTDGSKCCVCNLSGASCKRICTNSRGINRHFRAAPHFLGQELHCNHPTHPCGASFMRQDVLTRHLATPHPVERHTKGDGDGPTSGKRTTAKSSRVARGKPY